MADANPVEAELLCNRITDAIARHRRTLFLLVALLYVICFNGRWRVGIDSAIYRGLALNLVQGRGYTFGEWAGQQVYPGWPYMLAAIEWAFGPADRTPSHTEQARLLGPSAATTASVILVLLASIGAMLVTYRLMLLHYPQWVAVTITCGVATNAAFLKYSHELLTDVPFLLAITLLLWGWELLKRAGGGGARAKAIAVVVAGLLLAASTRPMFWVVALCWIAACVGGLIRGSRQFYATCLVLLLAVWAVLILLDPRFQGFNPLSGGYEREALELLPRAHEQMWRRLHVALHDQLPAAFFGEQLAPFSTVGSLIVLASCALLVRRHAMWVLLVWAVFVVTVLISSVPRYYLTVLPVMLLGWLCALCWLARRLPRFWGEVALVCGLALVTLNNLSASVSFVVEQRRTDFMRHYKRGAYVPALQMCQVIRAHVRPGQKVLGPSGSIMSLLTGVHVHSQREVLPRGSRDDNPQQVADVGFDYAVFPGKWYQDKDPVIWRLMSKRIIIPLKKIADTEGGMYLAIPKVTIPQTDWRNLDRTWRPPPDPPSAKPVKKKPTTIQAAKKTRPPTSAPATTRAAPSATHGF